MDSKNDSSKNYDECVICLEDLKNNVVVLDCNHKYHYDCIQSWYLKKNVLKCPLCRCESEIVNIINTKVEVSTNIQDKPRLNRIDFQELYLNSYCCVIL
tara:strand:+ start:471 stop:767 length:297 start_codon:yes stop_codon:yes gene_type:complete